MPIDKSIKIIAQDILLHIFWKIKHVYSTNDLRLAMAVVKREIRPEDNFVAKPGLSVKFYHL